MSCLIESKDILDICESKIVQQTSFWAQLKDRQGITSQAFEYKIPQHLLHSATTAQGFATDDLLVLINQLDNKHSIAYVPYGPKLEPVAENQGVFLEELSEVLRSNLPANCISIRYDLPWENLWAQEDDFYDSSGFWTGPPAARNQEFRVNFNTRHWNLYKSHSDNLPTNTIFLNLKQDESQLLNNMKPKTRYNIRLASRRGVTVKSFGLEKLDVWYALYRETSLRNGIALHDIAYFRNVLETHKTAQESPVEVQLLMAEHEGDNLAAMFLILSGCRATYLYGASSSKKQNLMAPYALQWAAIKIARRAGYEQYDLFGTAPNPNPSHPLHGLYRFKSGFGGRLYHRMGCWDYPLSQESYTLFRAGEASGQSYHVKQG